MKNIAVYIHWPFCKSKCPYCDFNSHVRESIELDKWNRAYLKEIDNNRHNLTGKKIVSVFFGGGTPSLMPSFIVANIIDKLAGYSVSHNTPGLQQLLADLAIGTVTHVTTGSPIAGLAAGVAATQLPKAVMYGAYGAGKAATKINKIGEAAKAQVAKGKTKLSELTSRK